MKFVTIPLVDVSSRAYIEWQCNGPSGITLNRLAEVCGCHSDEQESHGCHHPEGTNMCLGHECPIAYIDYPAGLTEEEENRYTEGYGDEIDMELATVEDARQGANFGSGGTISAYWMRERRRADEAVEAALAAHDSAAVPA